jgi:hypothetical protein
LNSANKIGSQYEVVAVEPLDVEVSDKLLDCVPVIPFEEGFSSGDLLFLAIPGGALKQFLQDNFDKLSPEAIMVDCTNSPNLRNLKHALADLGIESDHWVKGLNDNGAIALLQQKPYDKRKLHTQICGPSDEVVTGVKNAVMDVFGLDPKIVPVDQYENIEDAQDTIGKEWIHATIFTVVEFILIMIYVICQYEQRPNFHWRQIPTRPFNRMSAWLALWNFAFCLLPGTLARIIKQLFGPQTELHPFILWGLGIRKHIGLLALYFLFIHACMMLLLWNTSYYNHMLLDRNCEDCWRVEWAMFMAVVSTSFFIISGIASLPSVGASMNKAQFQLVFGPVVWLGLVMGMLHILFLGSDTWHEKDENPYAWAGDMPPVTMMAALIPLVVLGLKFVQVTLSIGQRLLWLVRGKECGAVVPVELALPPTTA